MKITCIRVIKQEDFEPWVEVRTASDRIKLPYVSVLMNMIKEKMPVAPVYEEVYPYYRTDGDWGEVANAYLMGRFAWEEKVEVTLDYESEPPKWKILVDGDKTS